jgi:hypothetical protein
MLSQIINAFKQNAGPLDINELGRRLGIERSALEGMLGLLVRQGRLREIRPGSEECAHCRNRAGCGYLKSGNLMGIVYELPGSNSDNN